MKKIFIYLLLSFIIAVGAKADGFWNTFNANPDFEAWSTDRYAPELFESQYFDGDNRLHIQISSDDNAANRGGQSGTFYNTHGRQIQTNIGFPAIMRGKLYIGADWATQHRRTDIWGVLSNASNEVTDYPIIGFANTTGSNPTFRIWDQDITNGWVDISYPVNYGQWYDFVVEYSNTDIKYYINNELVLTDLTVDMSSSQLKAIIVQGYNFGDPALDLSQQAMDNTYDIYWDDIAVYAQGYNVVNLTQGTVHNTIQNAIDATTTLDGDFIKVGAGTYNESVNLSKRLTIEGAGSGTEGTIITKTGGSDGAIDLMASGLNDAIPVKIKDIRIQPSGAAGISVGTFVSGTNTEISYVELENVKVIGTSSNAPTEQERGLYVDLTSSLSHLKITNCEFSNLTYGWYFQKAVSADASNVQFVDVTNSTFNNDIHKGIYCEKLSNAVFTNCIFDNNGMNASLLPSYFAPWSAGIDINVKAGAYSNISFVGCSITNNGIGGAKEGAGIMIKARNDGSYSGFPASLDNILISGCTISGNERGIRFGEPTKDNTSTTNIVLSNNTINNNRKHYLQTDGTDYGDVVNMLGNSITLNSATINAGQNVWYVNDGQSIQAVINLALDADIINVASGNFTESLNISKALTINGANSGTVCSASRVAESIITGLLTVNSNNVTINGFTITNPTGNFAISNNGKSNMTVTNNIITSIGNSATSGNTHAIAVTTSSMAIDNVNISNNCFSDIHGGENPELTGNDAKNNNGTASAVAIGWSNAPYDITNLIISNNNITDVNACYANDFNNGGKGAYGIIINTGAGSAVGKAIGTIINYNNISGLEGLWSHGIGLEGETPGAQVTYNTIDDLISYKTPSDATGLMIEDNAGAASVAIHNNSFTNCTWGIINLMPTLLVDATCNWYGTEVPTEVAAKIFGNIDYTPFNTNIEDECSGNLPVRVVREGLEISQHLTITEAINAITTIDGDEIYVAAGTYIEGTPQIIINKSISIIGEYKKSTFIKPALNVNSTGDARGFIYVQANKTFNLSNVTIDGEGKLVCMGILSRGTGTIENCNFKNIALSTSGQPYDGRGIAVYENNMTIANCYFTNIGRIGIFLYGQGVTNAQVTDNTYIGKNSGDYLDYGIELSGGAKGTISGNIISNCGGVALVDNSGSAAIMATTYWGTGTEATIIENTIDNCSTGIYLGYYNPALPSFIDYTIATAHYNLITNCNYSIVCPTSILVDATCNWYGTNDGYEVASKINGNVNFVPYWISANGDCTGGLSPDGASVSLTGNNYTSPIWTDNNYPLNANATVPANGNAPTKSVVDVDFNNLSSVEYSGSESLSIPYNNAIGRVNNISPKTLFVYFKPTNVTSKQVVFEAGGTNSGFNVYVYNNKIYVGIWNMSQRRYFYQAATVGENYLVSLEFDGYQVKSSINGTFSATLPFNGFIANNNANGVGASYNGTRCLESISSAGINYRFNGKIAEVLCYNTCNDNLRNEIIDYINAKYLTNYQKTIINSTKSTSISSIDDYSWDEDGEFSPLEETGLSVNNNGAILSINYSTNEELQGKLSLYNETGMIVKSVFTGTLVKGVNYFTIETNEFTSGVYFLTAETNSGVETKQVIIIK